MMKWFFKTWLGRAVIAIFVGGVALAAVNTPPSALTIGELRAVQNSRLSKGEMPLQILEGGSLPSDVPGVLSDYIGNRRFPERTRVDVWEKPDGTTGYTITILPEAPVTATSTL